MDMSCLKSKTYLPYQSSFQRGAILASLFLLAAITLMQPVHVLAQEQKDADPQPRYSFSLTDIPLSRALDVLIDKTQINLFYESDMVKGKITFCAIEDRPVEDVLRCVLQQTDLDFYQLSSGMYILVNRPRAEARFGALAGLVLDAQTGEPLPDAAVLLAYAETGTATNNDGRFSLSRLDPGLHPVVVTHVAYEDLYDSLYVGAGQATSIKYEMNPRTFISSPIIIDGLQERVPSERLQSEKVQAQDIILNPGHTPSTHVALNDVVGVGGSEAFADIHVQGGDSGEHLHALDGIPIFVPIRNGGFFGAFSPFALSQITVHKAGFDASEGSYLAGVVDIEHELATHRKTLLDVQVDALSANARLQGSLKPIKQVQLSWMVAGRVGLWRYVQPGPIKQQLREWSRPNTFIYENLVTGATSDSTAGIIDTPVDIHFTDFHAAARVRIGTRRSLYFSMYEGHNAFGGEALPLDPALEVESGREDYRWSNQMMQARYEWVLGHRTFIHVSAWSSNYRLVHPVDRFPFSPGDTVEEEHEGEIGEELEVEDFNQISEQGFKLGFDTSLGARHTVSGAIEPVFTKSEFALSVDPTGVTDPVNHGRIMPVKTRIQSFVQDDIALSNHTQLKAGARFTYVPVQQRLYAEPRLSLRHDIPDGPGGAWALYGATGLYRQFLFQFDVSDYNQSTLLPGFRFWMPLGRNTRASSAYHGAVGLLFMPVEAWQIRLEGYYKHQPQLAVLDYIAKNGIQKAQGYAFGGGISVTYDRPLLRFQAQYEYGDARRRIENRFGGNYIRVPWNAPHQLQTRLNINVLDGLTATVRWEGIYRRAWAYRQAYYDYLEPLDSQVTDSRSEFSFPNQHILGAFSQMDAGLSYRAQLGRVRVESGLQVVNVWNRSNVFDWILEENGASRNRTNRLATPRYISASLRIRY